MERQLFIDAQGQASNGYSFDLNASRSQPGGGAASIQVSNGTGSASYMLRRPREVSKHRIVADFGERGHVSMRFRSLFDDHRRSGNCRRSAIRFGRLEGRIRFEGEHGFTRFSDDHIDAFSDSTAVKHGCRRQERAAAPRGRFSDSSLLSSCGGEAGAGFFAAEVAPEQEAFFLATKTERTKAMTIIRAVELSGAARSFDVQGPRRARVVPPEPFTGRAKYRSGELDGAITAALPGAGRVREAPGRATLQRFPHFKIPKCLPDFFGREPAGSRLLSADAAIAEAIADFVLPNRLRRLLSR